MSVRTHPPPSPPTEPAVTWDGHTAADLALRCDMPGVELFAETTSTLDVAHVRAERGAPAGTVVLADRQNAGRGRLGRRWSSGAGQGVWVAVIERPSDPKALDVLSLRVGLHLAESLDALAGARVDVKWPNDLTLGGGKLGGILVECRWSGDSLAWAAIGVGVNVVPPRDVDDAVGIVGVQRVTVLDATVHAVRRAAQVTGHLSGDELARYARRDGLRGRRLTSPATGTATGIDASGALVIDTGRGSALHRTGTIRFAEDS